MIANTVPGAEYTDPDQIIPFRNPEGHSGEYIRRKRALDRLDEWEREQAERTS